MGGKSNSSSPPTMPQQSSGGTDAMAAVAAMMPMMAHVMMSSQQSTPSMSRPPEPVITPSVDWDAKQAELRKRVEADVTADLKKRRGRQYTVLTSPLVEEDNPDTVSAQPKGGPGPR